ncbi:endo-1,4-beta-xylanase [Gaeumannomyces tritici R3-111a-1]|uniref:Endo-1,5-alpha-L-arabinanase A n=1 Tax=Gaeumannomyces tritici (strain R3-111a-1) TaxID=644352 RepID=J3PH35_GAET3|nr:endo-1,4-beta-xylanase [Gaeumannomyces tritici R3-111a-1]EJT69932.1 endo-1,4-beta-xylanase [Gaeumannomyces tritici R3-111a-1]
MRFSGLWAAALATLVHATADHPLDARSVLQARAAAALGSVTVTNLNDVRGNLHLPESWDGLPVRWTSSDPTVVGHDGLVKRREDGHRHVTLRATIEHEGVSVEREFTARVRQAVEKRQASSYEGYAFSYFTGNNIAGEKIYFAASVGNDALNWHELNRGQATLTSTMGTKGLRDPFLIRSPEGDTFYLIATDLSIGSGTSWGDSVRFGSLYLEVWESHDLVNWSAQRHIKVSPPNAGNTWAPEAYYDSSLGAYVVFWASSLYADNDPRRNGPTYHRMLYATTRDFVTFSATKVWQDAGLSRIDSTVIKVGNQYHRFTKDEGAGSTGCTDIIQESSSSLTATLQSWTREAVCIGRDAGTQAVEGPTVFKSNPGDVRGDKFYLFVDEYGGRGYVPLETADISNPRWRLSSSWNLPASPRHGTVIPVTKAELARLTGSTGKPKPANAAGEIARYDFSSLKAGGVLPDVSGNGADGKVQGGATVRNGALVLDGVDDYVTLPTDLVAGLEDMTIEAEVQLATDQQPPYFIFGIGNTGSSGAGAGYLFATGNPYRASITLTDYNAEQTVSSGRDLPRGQWVHLAYVIQGRSAILYLNGAEVGRNTQVNLDPGGIGGGATNNNYIGKSTYTSDRLLKGQLRKFAVFNRALSAAEVLRKSGNLLQLTGLSLADASSVKASPLVSGSSRSVLFYVKPGTSLAALAPTFTTPDGVTVSPTSGATVDFSNDRAVTYTLTNGADGTSATWTMTAHEMASPVLPGLYADPNIFIHNATYYIYATTDGFPGWGGKDFYVWSSRDMKEWTRTEKPILTLDGANGNVPWAVGNAWAPGFAERDGKFVIYHSGHHVRLNTKTIGAAVASHPLGPFTAQPDAMIFNNETVTSGQAIDPAAFRDPVSGKYYLYWGNGRPLYAQLADDMVSLVPGTTKQISGLNDFREGLFLVYRRGLYHMTYSIDDTGSEDYRVGYATAASPDGPWTYRGVVLAKRPELGILGTGHNSMAQVPGTDDWVIVYHRFGIPGGNGNNRETTIDRVEFDEQTGLMKAITPTLESVPARRISSCASRRRAGGSS